MTSRNLRDFYVPTVFQSFDRAFGYLIFSQKSASRKGAGYIQQPQSGESKETGDRPLGGE